MNDTRTVKDKSHALNEDAPDLKIAIEKTFWLDKFTDWLSDWCSPILVKETRQALKSRQFFWTFFLLLVAIAIWTAIGLTINDASVEFGNAGPNLLAGYWMILGFPLAIVIPFGAYRSLAREYEDGTIQLVSVTTMQAWQIVLGKLGSSMLQMLIYLSVIAPCIAFTYLLRGLSLPLISVGVLICVSGCFSLCCTALFFAGATRSKVYGVGVSIVLILLQIAAFISWLVLAVMIIEGEFSIMAGEGAFLTAGMIMAIISTGFLMFAAAASLISFDADNRSTLVRIMMLVQQTLFLGWCVTLMCYVMDEEQILGFSFVTAHYWLIMGFLLIGEDQEMSARVKRSIPASLLGRLFNSWFLPGSGRGMIFATVNIWFCAAAFVLAVWLGHEWLPRGGVDSMSFSNIRSTPRWTDFPNHLAGTGCVCLYASFFLAVTYLVCLGYRRGGRKVSGLLSLVSGVVFIFLMTGGSLLFHFNYWPSRVWDEYTFDQIFNWYWTSTEVFGGRGFIFGPAIMILIWTCMLAVCCIAWSIASRELLQSRLMVPVKVEEEVAIEKKANSLEKGESIDEIFGVLDKPDSNTQ